jgi:hypothetical protein
MNSKKHLRGGKKISHTCPNENCSHKTKTHWNMKKHIMVSHSTLKERQQTKYYCGCCDLVFFAPLYFNTHLAGIKHKNKIKNNSEI